MSNLVKVTKQPIVKKLESQTSPASRTRRYTYRWILHKFSAFLSAYNIGMYCKSPIFGKRGGKYEWQLVCYPNSDKSKDVISTYLTQITKYEVAVTCTIDARNSDDETLIQVHFEKTYTKDVKNWGFSSFMKHHDLERLKDDILIIKTDVTILVEEFPRDYDVFLHFPEVKLVQDLKMALHNRIVTDAVLKVDDFEISVHKSILSARSPVFLAAFQHNTLENAEGFIQIEDIDEETLILLVDFIYTGKVTSLSIDKAKSLLSAADKYDLPDLVRICEEYIIDDFKVSNVVGTLLFADYHNAGRLKDEAIAFIIENHWKFRDNKRLRIVAENSPKLLLEIISKLFSILPCHTKLQS